MVVLSRTVMDMLDPTPSSIGHLPTINNRSCEPRPEILGACVSTVFMLVFVNVFLSVIEGVQGTGSEHVQMKLLACPPDLEEAGFLML